MFKPAWRVLSALAFLTAVACGDDDDGSGPTGSISLTASPTSATIAQGGSGTITVTLTRGGGFSEPVNVTVEGLPTGVTATASPAQLTGTTTSTTVTVNVASTTAAGTYPITVRASATGVGAATATYSLTVTATPNYSLTASAVTINQAGSGTSTIAIQRTSFTGPVTLSLENPPAGVTGTFSPNPATADQSVLTLNVASTVATGTITLVVKGSATGPGDKTTNLLLTVIPPADYSLSSTPTSLTIPAGGNATTTVNIARTNFTGAVTLSLSSPPAGITASFNPAAPSGTTNSSVATINVASTVAPGQYNVIISGAATGVSGPARTTNITVNVTAAAGNFTISATPTALNLAAGASGNTSVAIVRTNFTTDVALSLVNPPAGITGVFTPATLTGTTLTSTLALTVASTVAAGTYPVTVRGTAGSVTQDATVNVTVTAAAGNFTISATPAALNLTAGSSGNTSVAIVRTNFTTDVALSLVTPPTGITGVFTPATLTGTTLTSTLALTVASTVAAGTYPVTVRGTAGSVTQNTTVNVTVTAPSGNNVTWEFCNTPNNVPVKFWVLSGTTWTEVTGTVVGSVTRFTFPAATGSTGIAYTASASGFSSTFVYFAQSTDLGSLVGTCTTPTTVTKTFNLTGQVGGEAGTLGYGGATTPTGAAASYNLTVAPGTYDWLWAFGTQSGIPPATAFTNYRIGRGEATSAGAVSVNRTGAPAFVTAPYSFTGGGSGFWQISQSLSGANGQVTSLSLGSILTNTGSGNMLFPQPGDRLSTDVWSLSAIHAEVDQNGKGDSRSTFRYVGSAPPASLTFALPGKVPAFSVASTSASIPWSATGSIPAEYQSATSTVSAIFVGAGGNATATLIATRGWLVANNMSTNFTLSGPTLPNFQPAWAPASPLTSTTVSMTSTNLTGPPTAGGFLSIASRIQ